MSDSNASQIGGKHYKRCKIQPWDYVIANDLDYFQGSIIKYVTRWKDKGWVQDLYKARHFLDKYIEVMEKESFNATERPDGQKATQKEQKGSGEAYPQGGVQGSQNQAAFSGFREEQGSGRGNP